MPNSFKSDACEQLFRSALYIPGSNDRALEKAKSLGCDAIIFDLEDAVSADVKEAARDTLCAALRRGDFGARRKIVRINGLDTSWGHDDLTALSEIELDGIAIPKVETLQMLEDVAQITPNVPLWAMMETPLGILNAIKVAAHPQLAGMIMGTNDLAKDLNARFREDRLPMMTSLQVCLLAARAYGLVILDGVYNTFQDDEGLASECAQGRDLGFDGKTVIHPAQLTIANAAFSPSEVEIDLARRQVEAFAAAESAGSGVAVVDGSIVENLHVATARALLEKARRIAITC